MSTDRTAEILNYLSAISRDVGELRTEVKQINTRLEQFREEVNTRLARIEVRLDRLEARVDQIEARLTIIEREHRLYARRLDRLEGPARADIEELKERVSELESKQA